jgi:hypothetical protein
MYSMKRAKNSPQNTPVCTDIDHRVMQKPSLRGVEGIRRIASKPIEHYRSNLVRLLTLLNVMCARCEAVCVQFIGDCL